MTSKEFLDAFTQMVLLRASNDHLVDTLAFVAEVADRLEDDPVFGDFTITDWSGTGSKNRSLKLHGFTQFEASDGTFGLIVGVWSDDDDISTLQKTMVDQNFSMLQNFVKDSISGKLKDSIIQSNSAYEAFITINQLKTQISKIRLHLLSNMSLSSKFKEYISDEIEGVTIEHHIWDLERLKALYESTQFREPILIEFEKFGFYGVPCLEATDVHNLRSFLCVINGELLANIFERYGSRLLEGNVRSFLGLKGVVNQQIKNTIKESPQLFFAYNNGIAATASKVVVSKNAEMLYITSISDLQIVNGGQTTSSLFNARKKDNLSLKQINIALKLTEVDTIESASLIPKIAEYANTQNKIAAADFFSNHPVHQKMELISRKLLTPSRDGIRIQAKWYYERSRGQYQNERLYLSGPEKNRHDLEYPVSQLINKTELAKYDSSFREKPYWVSLGANSNFVKYASHFVNKTKLSDSEYWATLENQYEEGYYKKIICIAILWKKLEKLISDARGNWYEGDYRAQIVTYSVAILFHLIRIKGGVFNFKRIWEFQSTEKSLDESLVSIAKLVQKSILKPPTGITNVGQWCKREKCWEVITNLNFDSVSISKDYFVAYSPTSIIPEDKKSEEVTGIEAKDKCIELLNNGFWIKLINWKSSIEFLLLDELELLKKTESIQTINNLSFPSDFQNLLKIKRKSERFGFKFEII